jgi:hypothetical protein
VFLFFRTTFENPKSLNFEIFIFVIIYTAIVSINEAFLAPQKLEFKKQEPDNIMTLSGSNSYMNAKLNDTPLITNIAKYKTRCSIL